MKKIMLIPLLLMSSVAIADGQTYYMNFGCGGCHGLSGGGTSSAPQLNDKTVDYIVDQLHAFQNGARQNATMGIMSKMAAGKEREIAEFITGVK
jgi:cytochrome c553